jgi:DNA-binding GntR family transcriptional regulator
MSKSGLIYTALRERILSGRFSPGYRVVVDSVAREFGVSAGPVREALRQLEGQGLIRHEKNVGATVLGMDERVFKEGLAVMAVLEGVASAESAPLLTAEDFAELRRLNDLMRDAAERADMLAFGDLNRSFHKLIYVRCPNQFLREEIDRCWERVDVGHRQIFVRIPLRHQESIDEHDRLIEMLEGGSPAAEIDEFVKAHKRRTLLDLEERERQEQMRLSADSIV